MQLTAVAAAGYRFDHWTGDLTGSFESCEHQYDGQQVCDGCVHTDLYVDGSELAQLSGGSVTLAPPGGTYDTGTSVQLTAVAAAGYRFDHWTGDLTGSTNPASISMTANRSVTAVDLRPLR